MISASSVLASRTRSSAKVSFLSILSIYRQSHSTAAKVARYIRSCQNGSKGQVFASQDTKMGEERVGRYSAPPTDLLDAGRLKKEEV
jgi:hypothetical protein